MSEKHPPWLDWLLYFGSKDERHRAGADRAGHLSFWFVFLAATVDFLVKLPRFKAEGDGAAALELVALDLVVLLGGGLIYGWLWIRAGVTLADTPVQRRLLKWLAPLAGVGAAATAVPWGESPDPWFARIIAGVVVGVVAWGGTVLLCRGMDRAARRKVERMVGHPEDNE